MVLPLQIAGKNELSDDVFALSCALIKSVWPDYVELFIGEMNAYRSAPDVFDPYYVTAIEEDRVSGFAIVLSSVMSVDLVALSWVAVDECSRRQNIGKRMISMCVGEAERRNKTLILTTDIPDFYVRQGFEIIDEYKKNNHFLLKFPPESVVRDGSV